jgi:hypothetical protein
MLVSVIHEASAAEYAQERDDFPKRLRSIAGGFTGPKGTVTGSRPREHIILKIVTALS